MKLRFTSLAALLFATALFSTSAFAATSAPTVSTAGTSNVTYSSANLYGNVNPHGLSTTYYFEYGTTSGYGTRTLLTPAGGGTKSIELGFSVTGLQSVTTYHYRVAASNSDGTSYGKGRVFTTSKIPLSVQISGVPNPVIFGSPFFVEGSLAGTGAANHEVALQSNPFPYIGGFQDVGNPELTNSTGSFSFPYVGLAQNTQLRVVTVGKTMVSSPIIIEDVAVRVSFSCRSTNRHGYAYLSGNISPAEPGALVGFQLLRPGGKSINEGGTSSKPVTAAYSHFGHVVHIKHPGLYQALVEVTDGSHVSAYSKRILIR